MLSFPRRIPIVELKHVEVDAEAVRLVLEEYASQPQILPVGFDADGALRVALREV